MRKKYTEMALIVELNLSGIKNWTFSYNQIKFQLGKNLNDDKIVKSIKKTLIIVIIKFYGQQIIKVESLCIYWAE